MHRTSRPTAATGVVCTAIAVISVALLAASPLAAPGLPDSATGPLHLAQAGLLAARSRAAVGALFSPAPVLASPSGAAAGPLAYAVAGASLLGLQPQGSFKAIVVAAVIFASLGSFLSARRLMSPIAAVIASAAYVLSPVFLQALYIRGDYDRLLALALMPACLWGLLLIVGGSLRLGFVALSLSLALTAAADEAAALAVTPVVAVAAAAAARTSGRRAALAVCMALSVSALVVLSSWAANGTIAGRAIAAPAPIGRADLDDLVAIPQTADSRAANPEFPPGFGGHLVILALPCLALAGGSDRSAKAARLALLALAGVTAALLARAGGDAGQTALLGVGAMALACLVGAAADAWKRGTGRRAAWVATAWLLVALGATPYLFPSRPFVDWSKLSLEALCSCASGAAGEARFECPPSAAAQWLHSSVESTDSLSLTPPDEGHLGFVADLREPESLALPVSYSQGILATIDGQPVEPSRTDEGLTAVLVPAGRHKVSIETGPRSVLHWASLAVVAALAVLILGASCLPAGGSRSQMPVETRLAAALAISGMALLAAKTLYVEPHTAWFRIASPAGRALASAHETDVSFADSIALIGYTMQRNLPPQGEAMQVTLYWQPPGPRDRDVTVSVSLVAPTSGQVVLRSAHTRPGGVPARRWTAKEYVIDAHSIALPADLPAVSYDLRVEVRDAATGAVLPTADGSASAILQPVQVLYHLPLDVTRFAGDGWYAFGDSIRLIGSRVDSTRLPRGASLSLTLYWRTEAPESARMMRFADLVSADGRIVAQIDGWPVGGLYPTDRWLPQHNIADFMQLRVPMSATAGEYHILVGLHEPDTLSLPTVSTRSGAVLASGAVTLPTTVLIE